MKRFGNMLIFVLVAVALLALVGCGGSGGGGNNGGIEVSGTSVTLLHPNFGGDWHLLADNINRMEIILAGESIFGLEGKILNERIEFIGQSPLLPDFGDGGERGKDGYYSFMPYEWVIRGVRTNFYYCEWPFLTTKWQNHDQLVLMEGTANSVRFNYDFAMRPQGGAFVAAFGTTINDEDVIFELVW